MSTPKRAKKVKAEASANKAVTERPSHLWKPGQSGNPDGRPKVVGEIRDLARENTITAFNTLLDACQATDAPWAARVAAAAHILDRGYGKPTQHVSQTVHHVQKMTDDELLAYLSGADEADGSERAASASGDPSKPH